MKIKTQHKRAIQMASVLFLFICFLSFNVAQAAFWVNDANNCPEEYQSINCSPQVVCGFDVTTHCKSPDTINSYFPSGIGTSSAAPYPGFSDGGYVIDCVKNASTCCGTNCSTVDWLCGSKHECYYQYHVKTECQGSPGNTSGTCSNECISGYCDLGGDYGCEIQIGTSCGTNKVYDEGCNCVCETNYMDCDEDSETCEAHIGSPCDLGAGLYGVWQTDCYCAPNKVYFETGTEAKYSSEEDPFLWGTQYGDGPLMQLFKYNSGQQQTDTVFLIDNDGCFGVGSADPVAMLDVSGQIHVGAYSGNNNAVPKSYVDDCCSGAGSYWTQSENDIYYNSGNVGIGTANPSTMFHVCGQGQFTDINMLECNGVGSRNITNVNKLTVNTIDPIHEIDGEEYATFVSFYAGGQKMETSGVLQLKAQTQNNYQYIIDFNNLDVASDLWLFWKTIHKDLDEISVILTPGFDGRVWYKKIGDSKIIIYSDQVALSSEDLERDLEVSYILFAPRYDYKKWPNLIHKSGQSKK